MPRRFVGDAFVAAPATLPPLASAKRFTVFPFLLSNLYCSLSSLSSLRSICICTSPRFVRLKLAGEIVDWTQLTSAIDPDYHRSER